MILRIDRLQAELPPPSDPDPAGAAVVQELLGGKFGEMSTFMNYTFQSFNFRARQGARPFYDLVANIAAEEFGHIELVATAINTMLTGAARAGRGCRSPADLRNPQHFARRRRGRRCVQDSNGKPWNGDYVISTGDLVEDLTHNFFLETGARNGKLKVYEMVDHPAARALTGYLLVRGGVHQVAYARAVENLTGADLIEAVPGAAHPDRQDPRVPAAHRAGRAPEALPLLAERLQRAGRGLQRPAPGDRRRARGRRRAAGGRPAVRPAGRRRASSRPTTPPRRSPRSHASCARRPASATSRRAWWPTTARRTRRPRCARRPRRHGSAAGCARRGRRSRPPRRAPRPPRTDGRASASV